MSGRSTLFTTTMDGAASSSATLIVSGFKGADWLFGFGGKDYIFGGEGADTDTKSL